MKSPVEFAFYDAELSGLVDGRRSVDQTGKFDASSGMEPDGYRRR